MLNDKPCEGCRHFDPIMRGTNKGHRNTKWAWCAKHSIYPLKEGPGQQFPMGVKRMTDPAAPAKPRIVKVGEVVTNCSDFSEKRQTLNKAELLKTLKEQQQGGLLR